MARKGLNTDRIVEVAAELIAERGFDQFSLRELADRLGVKTASLYNHISSLSELTSNIGQLAFERMTGQLYSGTEDALPFDTLYHIAIGYRKFAKQNPELYKTIVKIPSTGSSDLIEKGQSLVHSLYPVLEACGLSEDDIIHFSRTIRSAMHGFVTLEEAGFFGTAVDADESYSYMIKALIEPLKTELGRKDA